MTNREDDGEANGPRVATLLAGRIVGQVLDEAYAIAMAAKESGHPLHYLSILKNLRKGGNEEDWSIIASQGDYENLDKSADHNSNLATSTPQKPLDDSRNKADTTSLIGQGDGDLELQQEELNKSTSLLINSLFDMSEVEQVVICDEMEMVQTTNDSENNEFITEAMSKIMDSYVNAAFNMAFGEETQSSAAVDEDTYKLFNNSEQSKYSYLTDTIAGDIGKDIAFYVENECMMSNMDNEGKIVEIIEIAETESDVVGEVMNAIIIEENDEETREKEEAAKEDVARFENAYLTLNRDYDPEQATDEEGDILLQEPKAMQEVELNNTYNSGVDNDIESIHAEPIQEVPQELTATSAVSASSRKSKSSIVSRCRTTGARLLSCLRGWWRRKTPGKLKDSRTPGSIRGICPLSPDARRRAASLLDQRHLYSPSAKQSATWKYNTVDEAVINSIKWKEYTFDMTPDPAEKLALEEYY